MAKREGADARGAAELMGVASSWIVGWLNGTANVGDTPIETSGMWSTAPMPARFAAEGLNTPRGPLRTMDPRTAWRRKHAAQSAPWRGPVHAAPLLEGLAGRVVELGAGGGKVGAALPGDAIALDWAPEGLREGSRPRLVADVRALPFRDASVDALVAIHVLGHLLAPDRAAALGEWRRALRPGGALVLEVFARGDAREGEGEEVEPGTWRREGIATHHFDEAELRGLLAGWKGAIHAEVRAMRWGTRRALRGRFTRAA